MRKLIGLLVLLLALGASSTALAQSPLAGQDLRLQSLTAPPANLGNGNAGIWNHSGVFTWTTSTGTNIPVLTCAICTVGASSFTVAGTISSTLNGFQFPDSTTQTTAFTTVGAGAGSCTNCNVSVNAYGQVTAYANGSGGGITATYVAFDPVALVNSGGLPVTLKSGNYTLGHSFMMTVASTITGIKFYWAGGGGAKTIKCSIYDQTALSATALVSTTVAVNAAGIYTCTFGSPLAVTGSLVGHMLNAATYENSGSFFTSSLQSSGIGSVNIFPVWNPTGNGPVPNGPSMYDWGYQWYTPGDGRPASTSGSDQYPTMPIFTVP